MESVFRSGLYILISLFVIVTKKLRENIPKNKCLLT